VIGGYYIPQSGQRRRACRRRRRAGVEESGGEWSRAELATQPIPLVMNAADVWEEDVQAYHIPSTEKPIFFLFLAYICAPLVKRHFSEAQYESRRHTIPYCTVLYRTVAV